MLLAKTSAGRLPANFRIWPARFFLLLLFMLASCATAPPAEKVDNHWNGYTSVAISPDGRLAAAANRYIVVLFDIEQRRQVGWFWSIDEKGKSFRQPRPGLGDTLQFIDETRIVTTGMGGIATVWDIRTGTKTQDLYSPVGGMYAISLAWSPESGRLSLGTQNGTILTYRLENNEFSEADLLLSHVGRVNDLEFSADGKYLASAGDDRAVVIWDMETGMEIARHESEGDLSDLEVVSARRSLVIAGDDVEIWKFLTPEEAVELKEDNAVAEWVGTGALYALQAGLLAAGLGGGISTHDPANCGRFVTVSPSGEFLVDVKPGPMSNKITVLDVDQNEIIREVDVPNAICDLEFTADGEHLLLAGDGGLFLVETDTWTQLPMHLIVDAFSHAPQVVLAAPVHMGLGMTGYQLFPPAEPSSDPEDELDTEQIKPD